MRKLFALVAASLVMLAGCGGAGLVSVLDTLLRVNHVAEAANLVDVYILGRDQNPDDLSSALLVASGLARGQNVDVDSLPPGDYRIVFTEAGEQTMVADGEISVKEGEESEATLDEDENGDVEVKTDSSS